MGGFIRYQFLDNAFFLAEATLESFPEFFLLCFSLISEREKKLAKKFWEYEKFEEIVHLIEIEERRNEWCQKVFADPTNWFTRRVVILL